MSEDYHQGKVSAHRQVCLRLRHQEGSQQGHGFPQGQQHVSLGARNNLLLKASTHLSNYSQGFCLLLPFYRKLSDGLFLQCCAEVAELYPKIKYENIIIDNCCMQVCLALSLALSVSLSVSHSNMHPLSVAGPEPIPV